MSPIPRLLRLAALFVVGLALGAPGAALAQVTPTPSNCDYTYGVTLDIANPSSSSYATALNNFQADNASNPNCTCLGTWLGTGDYELGTKLLVRQKVKEYCTCRNEDGAGYCSCLWADGKTSSDCAAFNPPSVVVGESTADREFGDISDCVTSGYSASYCACRWNGGSDLHCSEGALGTSIYQQQYDACMAMPANAGRSTYCACVASGNPVGSCDENNPIVATPVADVRASELTSEQTAALAGQSGGTGASAEEAGTGLPPTGIAASGTATADEPARLFGLPSIVPACARGEGVPDLNCMLQVAGNIVQLIFGLTGSLAFLMFVWGGFQFVTAMGDDSKVKKGKDVMRNAVIGILIIMLSGYVVDYLLRKLQVNPEDIQGGTCPGGGIQLIVNGKTDCYTNCDAYNAESSKGGASYSCQDTNARPGGKTDCITGLCEGGANNVCCPNGE